tara:strand:+ start:1136 stop:1777 length:642 start_codon:yes stop_codon:yes gene_type:complete
MTTFAEHEYYYPEYVDNTEGYHEDPLCAQTEFSLIGDPLDIMFFETEPEIIRDLLIASGMSSEEMMDLSNEILEIEESFQTSGEWMIDVPQEVSQCIDYNEMIVDYEDELKHIALTTPHNERTTRNCAFDKQDRTKTDVLITIKGEKYNQGESQYGKVFIPPQFNKYVGNVDDIHEMVIALTHVEYKNDKKINNVPFRALRVRPVRGKGLHKI